MLLYAGKLQRAKGNDMLDRLGNQNPLLHPLLGSEP